MLVLTEKPEYYRGFSGGDAPRGATSASTPALAPSLTPAVGLQRHRVGPPASRVSLSSFKGPKDTLAAMERLALGERGEKSFLVRQFTEWVIRDVFPKDYNGEIVAIRNVCVQPSPWRQGTPLVAYVNDPRHVEWIKDPQRVVEEISTQGTSRVDCDEIALLSATMALQVGREVEFVALGFSPKSLTHVGVRVKEPKSNRWIWIDPVAGPREREAAATAKEVLTWSLE